MSFDPKELPYQIVGYSSNIFKRTFFFAYCKFIQWSKLFYGSGAWIKTHMLIVIDLIVKFEETYYIRLEEED